MDKICKIKKFKLQEQQIYIRKNFKNRLLVYHQIGSGKTCTAINTAEKFKNKHKIIVILPASLINNFKDELRSECGNYLTDKERDDLKELSFDNKEYKKIIEKSNNRINKYYKIYSYHKLIELIKTNKINFNNKLIIIDEIQNMISECGSFCIYLNKQLDKSKNYKLMLLTATPIFDKPKEIALTMNLLIKDKFDLKDFDNKFIKKNNMINKKIFREKLKGYISYYRGAPDEAFPSHEFKIVKCKMSDFQYKSYLASLSDGEYIQRGSFKSQEILDMSSSFFIGPRMMSNICFPNKLINKEGYQSLTKDKLELQNIKQYSIKFYKILKKIKQTESPTFFYSNFKDYAGIKSFSKLLEAHGFKDFKNYGPGEKRYAIWSGDDSIQMKQLIKNNFNKYENKNGSIIKIILGSPSIKEGVSLLRISQVHILEPYWNISRIKQIIGRAIRYCSHKDVAKYKRHVDIYLYISTYPEEDTIDNHIWKLAKKKQKIIDEFETELKSIAFDCKEFYKSNIREDNQFKCKK